MKKFLSICIAAVLALSLAACGASSVSETPAASSQPAAQSDAQSAEHQETSEPLRIAGLKGPTTMGLVNLMAGENAGDCEFSMYGSADEIVPLLVKGELDAAAVPANLAAALYSKTSGAVQVACINTLGVLYVVEKGENIHSVSDLKGTTILSTGKGTTPEYVLRYVLAQNGIDPDNDVTIEYLSEATEVAARLTADESENGTVTAMLPQPFVTSVVAQSEGAVRVALDMNEEWQKTAGSRLVTGVLVARRDAIENNPERFADFLTAYKASAEAANNDTAGTAALCEEYGIVAKAALAEKALPACNIVFETGDEMKTDLQNYYQVLFDADPASVGGQIPDENFYYAN